MRIGIVCPYDIYKPGGVQSHVEAVTALLRRRGHEITVITPRPRSARAKASAGTYHIGVSTRVRANSTTFDVSTRVEPEEIDAMYGALKLDLIHFHEPFVPLLSNQLAGQAPCLTVGTFHAAIPETFVGRSIASVRPYMRAVLKNINVATAVSPAASAHIEDLYDGPITFIPNGIDLKLYRSASESKRDPATILFLGRLEKRKGAKHLIDAFELVNQVIPEARLLIAGDGPLKNNLRNYAADRGIHNVKFLGYVDEDRKRELISSCTVYTSPALYGESFGIVLLEAMAIGTPIVAHVNPGYEWVMREVGALSLVDAKNREEYARRLLLMMRESALRKTWQTWANSYVKQYSYDKVVDAYETLYRQYLKK